MTYLLLEAALTELAAQEVAAWCLELLHALSKLEQQRIIYYIQQTSISL